jgi:flagellar biosynthesis/type III secretory pathway M-ring protein FliF/YscJ
MNSDLMGVIYNASIVFLAFVVAIIVTKIIAKYARKEEKEDR